MRVALFFDGNNFYRSLRSQYKDTEIDYEKLVKWVIKEVDPQKASFVGAYYYTGYCEKSSLERFLGGLELRRGFFIRREPIVERESECPNCNSSFRYQIEKRVDTRLVAEMVKMAAIDAFDRAIVFSGDEDLVPALETVASLGKQVFVATWGGYSLSRAMRVNCFGVIDLVEGMKYFSEEKKEEASEKKCTVMSRVELANALYRQLLEAHQYFNGIDRQVTRWYFENRWKPTGPCPPPGDPRQEVLDMLIEKGKVEVFSTTVNGREVLAVRPKREPPTQC